MKKVFLSVFSCIMLLVSCQNSNKQTTTISKEEQEDKLANEQFAMINLSEVDEYPTFAQCPDTLPKTEKIKCFEQNLSQLYANSLKKHQFAIADGLNDVINVYITIDNMGKIIFERSESSEKTRELLPQLDSILKTETQLFEAIQPAKKQDIEVSTRCKLPLVINVK